MVGALAMERTNLFGASLSRRQGGNTTFVEVEIAI